MVSMFERFRKKSSPENETTADVAATLAELEDEVEAEVVASGDDGSDHDTRSEDGSGGICPAEIG